MSGEVQEQVSTHDISPRTCSVSSYLHLWRFPEPNAASVNQKQNTCMPSGKVIQEKEQEPRDFRLSSSLTCCIFCKRTLEKIYKKSQHLTEKQERQIKQWSSALFSILLCRTIWQKLRANLSLKALYVLIYPWAIFSIRKCGGEIRHLHIYETGNKKRNCF